MIFCPVCKNLLFMKEENGKNIGYCKNCGFKRMELEISALESNKNIVGDAGVLDKTSSGGFAHKCPKCGFDFAEVGELGEILNSEATVFLYTCKKCGNVTRETGKS